MKHSRNPEQAGPVLTSPSAAARGSVGGFQPPRSRSEVRVERRQLLAAVPGAAIGLGACRSGDSQGPAAQPAEPRAEGLSSASHSKARVLETFRLGQPPWRTFDPFLFCVHHKDDYPEGNEALGPRASLTGRNLGSDFAGKDGWSMYHGQVVPGFPRHPHRGFETVTVARRGHIDHSDSLGATARYGEGDVQWMTAGRGIVHAEMFPLLKQEQPNPTELFQIWINLPASRKMVAPHFSMFWNRSVPELDTTDTQGKRTAVRLIAGRLADNVAPSPPPNSWAARPESDVAIWSIRMEAGASWTLPPARPGSNRTLYFFAGHDLSLAGQTLQPGFGARLEAAAATRLENGAAPAELLLLQGRPIGEPVVKHGPFVMNTREEIQQAMLDYRRTRFGGWPWGDNAPVHASGAGRFAVHADGRKESAG